MTPAATPGARLRLSVLAVTMTVLRPIGAPVRQVGATLLIRNDGNVPVNGPVTITLLASADTAADGADASLGTLTRVLRIKANSTRRLAFRLPLPAGLASGTYHVIARVDSGGNVTESDETNNDAPSGGTFTVG